MNRIYHNGMALYTMSPREAAKFELVLSSDVTYDQAEEIIKKIHDEATDIN